MWREEVGLEVAEAGDDAGVEDEVSGDEVGHDGEEDRAVERSERS